MAALAKKVVAKARINELIRSKRKAEPCVRKIEFTVARERSATKKPEQATTKNMLREHLVAFKLFPLVDDWLAGLSEDHFVRILHLVRRTFAVFGAGERRDLGQRASQGAQAVAAVLPAATWDEVRAALPLPLLRQLLGVQA